MKRSALTPLLLAAGALACTQEKPNVVLFVVDDMGPMDTSVPFLTDPNGAPVQYPLNHRYHTPNMERLSNQGIRFSQFYAQSVSSPSRCSLLTGQDAARHRTTNWIRSEFNNRDEYGPYDWNWQGLRRTDYLLPRLMQDAGYRTIHVGKAHLGPIGSEAEWPDSLGFDINIAGSSIGEPGSYLGENGYGLLRGTRSRAVPGLEKYHGSDTFLTEALTLEALEAAGQAIDKHQPFFLYLSHYAVHNPFEVDKRFAGNYQADSLENREALGYATLVEGMDKSLGDLLAFLEKKGVADKTLIIFLGDNGGDAPVGPARGWASSAPLRGKKGAEFEGGIRVPCIVAWAKPSQNKLQKKFPVARGAVSPQVGTIMDIYPTLAHFTGMQVPGNHPVDGQDLSRLLAGKPDPEREEVFLCHFPHEHRGSYYTTWRNGPWKLIYYYHPDQPENPQCVLYNLEKDPFETTDVLEENKETARRLLREMIARLASENAAYPVDAQGRALLPKVDLF